jgi:hypothetical protein
VNRESSVKYFFLSEGWNVGRVWEFGGLWNEGTWRRKPIINRLNLHIAEDNEKLWLYEAEDEVLMLEVKPATEGVANHSIGQVVLKRLMTAEQVLDRLCKEEPVS